MALVEVNGFSFAYPADGAARHGKMGERVLDEVSFQVEEGDFCLLVGSTGSGNTTLLRSLKPELMPEGERAGSITVAGKSLIENGEVVSPKVSRRALADGIGVLDRVRHAKPRGADRVRHRVARARVRLGEPRRGAGRDAPSCGRGAHSSASARGCARRWRRSPAVRSSW